jgi:RNA polymerase sigma factor (sigma-70 family)
MKTPRETALAAAGGGIGTAGVAGLTDGQLLGLFVSRHDDDAFEALLRRHGPMVLGVCRRILADPHEAEDAFQATFLVLVRKAASIAKQQSVGSWLYGVAYRIAVKAKARARRRRAEERQAVNRPTAAPPDEVLWRDLRPVLDEEVNRLPEKYRAPVVLCYLEGRAYAEAARQLGCSKGTIALRLAGAQQRLRARLNRRGVALSVGVFAALLSAGRTAESVPEALGEATARAASHWAVGGKAAGLVSAPVTVLVEAALSTLAWAKLKATLAVVLAVSVAGGSAGVLLHRVLAERPATGANETAAPKKGKKTLADRLDGLPPPKSK